MSSSFSSIIRECGLFITDTAFIFQKTMIWFVDFILQRPFFSLPIVPTWSLWQKRWGLSRSNLRNAIKLCRSFLLSYNIRLENVPHHGVRQIGNEWKIRRCLIAIYNNLNVNVVPENEYPEICTSLSNPEYGKIRLTVCEALNAQNIQMSQAHIRWLTYYIVFQNLRIQSGYKFHSFSDIHPAIIRHVESSESLQNASAYLLQCFFERFKYGPYTSEEVSSVAMMLFETFEDISEPKILIERFFSVEAQGMSQKITDHLEKNYGIYLTSPYKIALREIVYKLVARYKMGVLSERAGNLERCSASTSDYPLIKLICREIENLLNTHYESSVTLECCIPICDLVSFYIQNTNYDASRLCIGITTRRDSYRSTLVRELLLQNLSDECYQLIECCDYIEILEDLPTARKKYDVVLCDERFSNDPLLLGYSEFRNDIGLVWDYLRMLRNLCRDALQLEDIRPKVLDFRGETWQRTLQKEYECLSHEGCTLEEITAQTVCCKGCMSLLVFDSDATCSRLQFGDLAHRIRVNGKSIMRYLIFTGRIYSGNIRIINLLLYELAQDDIFWSTLSSFPSIDTINNQLNRFLR